jgi:hypothetical protein
MTNFFIPAKNFIRTKNEFLHPDQTFYASSSQSPCRRYKINPDNVATPIAGENPNWDRCYDLLKYFRRKIWRKNWRKNWRFCSDYW